MALLNTSSELKIQVSLIVLIILQTNFESRDTGSITKWTRLVSRISLALILLSQILQNIHPTAYQKSLSAIWVLVFAASATRLFWHERIGTLTTSYGLKMAQCVLALWIFCVEFIMTPCNFTELEYRTKNMSPLEDASLFSVITYSWLGGLIRKGFRAGLDMVDFWDLRHEDSSRTSTDRFQAAWTIELRKSDPSLRRALFRAFGKSYGVAAFFKLIFDAAQLLEPWLLKVFICSLGHMTTEGGIALSLVFYLNSVLQVVCKQLYFARIQLVGIHMKSALTAALYTKSLNFSEQSKTTCPTGRLISILGTDLERLEWATAEGHMVWSAPVSIIVALILLWELVGANVLAALPVMLFLLPFFGFSTTLQKRFQKQQMEAKDTRLRFISTALSAMRSALTKAYRTTMILTFSRHQVTKPAVSLLEEDRSSTNPRAEPFAISYHRYCCQQRHSHAYAFLHFYRCVRVTRNLVQSGTRHIAGLPGAYTA